MEVVQSQIDRDYLFEISGGDAEFERDLIQTFLEAAPALLASYATSIENNAGLGARHAAHTLKGSSRSIGATLFAEVCEEAEKAARADDLETCRQLLPKIEESYEALKVYGQTVLAEAA
jgi:HPt (histidine-containing phosphotransfer) domain-containing protein